MANKKNNYMANNEYIGNMMNIGNMMKICNGHSKQNHPIKNIQYHTQSNKKQQDKHKYCHYYLLPYYKHNNQSLLSSYSVLLAKKKCFNHLDGFIYQNPGQMVICGGRKLVNINDKRNIINNCIEQFYKQTGHFIRNKSNITYILSNNSSNNQQYFVFYKVCTYNEYCSLKRIKRPFYSPMNNKFIHNTINNNQTTYFKSRNDECDVNQEISSLKWVKLKHAKQIFSSIYSNPPCSGKVYKCVEQYLHFIFKHNYIPKREFKSFCKQSNLSPSFKYQIFHNILNERQNSPFFILFRQYIKWYFCNRCNIDWFKNVCVILSDLLMFND